ncbi:MAG: hypothetical protein IJ764_01595 [Bacteroidales bacterium]|nr:hypothetical protein [Bacteroidales bacterium]
MKNIRIVILSLALLSLALVSCRKDLEDDILNPNERYDVMTMKSYARQFEAVWQGINSSYVFWSRDETDWDAKYDEYYPKFAALDNQSKVDDSVFTDLWVGVVGGLLDHHFVLTVKNLKGQGANNFRIGGSAREVRTRAEYKETATSAQYAALANHERLIDGSLKVTSSPSNMRSALLRKDNGEKIAYFRLGGFNISNMSGKARNDASWAPLAYFYGIDWLNSAYGRNDFIERSGNTYYGVQSGWINEDDVTGIIIDVRGNGGGNASELTFIAGGLTQSNTHYGYSRTKEGIGRLDYSAWTPFILRTPSKHLNSQKPIVVLADCNSYSCAEITTQLIHSLPNGYFIGIRTGGATCPLMPGGFNILLSGVFGDVDKYGYYCYTSNFDLVTTDYTSLEGKGVTPDKMVQYEGANGKDEQLDAAIEYLMTK